MRRTRAKSKPAQGRRTHRRWPRDEGRRRTQVTNLRYREVVVERYNRFDGAQFLTFRGKRA